MTTPAIVPLKWNGNTLDYLKTKVDRQGCDRAQRTIVSVPTGTTTTTIVGLVPFNANEQISDFKLYCDALGTSVTMSVGIIYDDNVTYTNNQTLFTSSSTNAAAGGELVWAVSATNAQFVTAGNGWIVATVGGATTGTTGNISGIFTTNYDGIATVNPN